MADQGTWDWQQQSSSLRAGATTAFLDSDDENVNWPSPVHHSSSKDGSTFVSPPQTMDAVLQMSHSEAVATLHYALNADDQVCLDLWAEAFGSPQQVRTVQQNACFFNVAVTRALVSYSKRHDIPVTALNLCTILARNANNLTSLARDGAIDMILEAMSKRRTILDVQVAGCRALNNVSVREDNRRQILASGGVVIVLEVLSLHMPEGSAVLEACRTLRNLTCDGSAAPTGMLVAHDGGISKLIEALDLHNDNAVLATVATSALCNLSVDRDNKALVIEGGGVRSLIQTMRKHKLENRILLDGCRALANLSVVPDHKVTVAFEGALDVVLDALSTKMSHVGIVEQAERTLCYMSADVTLMRKIHDAGVIDLIGRVLREHPIAPRVHEYGIWTLTNLATDTLLTARLSTETVMSRVITSMRACLSDNRVQQEGCRYFCIAAVNKDAVGIATDCGAVVTLLDAMRRHAVDLRVQQLAIWALSNFRMQTDILIARIQFKREGGAEIVAAALRIHGQNPDLLHGTNRLAGSGWLGLGLLATIKQFGFIFSVVALFVFIVAISLTVFRKLCEWAGRCGTDTAHSMALQEFEGLMWCAALVLGILVMFQKLFSSASSKRPLDPTAPRRPETQTHRE